MGLIRRWVLLVTTIFAFILFVHLLFINDGGIRQTIKNVPLPGGKKHDTLESAGFAGAYVPRDKHPISQLIADADKRWRTYEESYSKTFRACVATYRRKYGRNPPPGFDEWYKFARERHAHNIDDFEQVMDDLRPFWAIQPRIMRSLAAHMWEVEDGIAGIHIRNHKVVQINNGMWRADTFCDMIKSFLKFLPDMDIPMNRMDQPRVVVPWDDMQALLAKEEATRGVRPEVINEFTTNMTGLFDLIKGKDDGGQREDPGWYGWAGKQYMEVARTACPPESHANNGKGVVETEETWKDKRGGIVKNFNLSSDLCTMGPEMQDKHGFLYSASTISATRRLVPVFGECKVNINSDILFPANMYWKDDDRYLYDDRSDSNWGMKKDAIVWRGVTSGGTQLEDNWQRMHRQRLVQLMNATVMQDAMVRVLTEQPEAPGEFENFRLYEPAQMLAQHADVGFVEAFACIPNCSFYDHVFEFVNQIPLASQFNYKYLIDVDGHSFSGRWRAFLMSKSIGIKATIFREWHDSRLFAWRHFVPMDNRYDDIFSILTYFMGTGDAKRLRPSDAFVPEHEAEAKRIALQGRDWAHKVLRTEDMEIYTFRLLLEYARLLDDNRDRIGYSGDGSELDKFDDSWKNNV